MFGSEYGLDGHGYAPYEDEIVNMCGYPDQKRSSCKEPSKRTKRYNRSLRKVRPNTSCGCGGKFIRKRSKNGVVFLGCSNYPKCKETRRISIPDATNYFEDFKKEYISKHAKM